MAPVLLLQKECGPKCKSCKHVEEIISIITKCSLPEFKAVSFLCHNWPQNHDTQGRTALHIAASCGKLDILSWLLEECKLDINAKDLESGYTPLHRSLLYGQLVAARLLIQYNSDIYMHDNEGLSPLDLAMFNRPPSVSFSLNEPNEVFTWGENHNNNLGHANSNRKTHPEVMDVFRKYGITIKQVVLCKYHSVFLSQSGQVYTCGHGHGGRLGHGDQQTVLVPKLLESIKDETCLEIAAATDHTLLRMEGGVLYTFGINSAHQLGQTPYVESSFYPKLVNVKSLKGRTITGICVGRFHSVVCTSDSLYTVGLNAGQLGHLKGEKYVSQLKLVSSLRHTDIGIAKISCSDAATICMTTKGDILVLHEYQCRKILSKWQDFDQVQLTGGNLDHNTGMDVLNEKGGTHLSVYIRNNSGQIFMWQSNTHILKRCHFAMKRQPKMSDMVVTNSNLLMITSSGEAFLGIPRGKKSGGNEGFHKEIMRDRDSSQLTPVQELVLMDEIEEFHIKRLPVIHRAVGVAADRKGRNFAIIQALPNCCLSQIPSVNELDINRNFKQLLSDADSSDSVHDALIQVEDKVWPVHCYVIGMRSDHCRSAIAKSSTPRKNGKLLISVEGVSHLEMEQIIQYMYTDTCDFLTIGHKLKQSKKEHCPNEKKKEKKTREEKAGDEIDRRMSAFQVEQKRRERELNAVSKNDTNKSKVTHDMSAASRNPIKCLQDSARKLGVKGLSKRLDAVKYADGKVVSNQKPLVKPKVKFDRSKLPELHDVTIATEDGKEIRCHKCVLICRLEYFYSMLARGWVESFSSSTLTLPVRSDVLEILLDFLYTDEALPLRDCSNEDLLCNVLVVADQMLAWRLKEMCEVALANMITMKNVSELLEFSSVYGAEQLKLVCQEFICLNITALLEARGLDICSIETMEELTDYYRSVTPRVRYRVMTPADKIPSQKYLDELVTEYESQMTFENQQHPKKARQVKKRTKTRNRSISEDAPPKASSDPAFDIQPDTPTSPRDEKESVSLDKVILTTIKDLNQNMEEEDKKLTALASKHEKTRWRPMNKVEGSCPIAPTQPEDVPVWSSKLKPLAWSLKTTHINTDTNEEHSDNGIDIQRPDANVTLAMSPPGPTSPSILATSPTSLRDIIMEESQPGPVQKSGLSSRFSWKDAKKRQARESQERLQKQPSGDGNGRESHDAKPVSKVTANPWATVGKVVSSFRDLMVQEKDCSDISTPQSQGTRRRDSQDGGMAFSTSPRGRPASGSKPVAVPTSPLRSENPWQRRTEMAASPPMEPIAKALNFNAIVKDEMEKTEILEKTKQKPLALIQLEEQAMLELLLHYNARNKNDVTITVERVNKAMAAPLWHHERDYAGAH